MRSRLLAALLLAPSLAAAQVPAPVLRESARHATIDPSFVRRVSAPLGGRPATAQPTPAPVQGASAASVSDATLTALQRFVGDSARATSARRLDANLVFVRVSTPTRMAPAPPGLGVAQGAALDFRVVGTDPSSGAPMLLKPWVGAENGGMRWRPGRPGAFTTSVRVGLRDSLNPTRPRRLSPAVRIYLAADADSLTPADLVIDRVNEFEYRAHVTSTTDADSLRLEVWGSDAAKSVVAIPYLRPRLALDVDRPSVAGYGLGVARLQITVPPGVVAAGDSVPVRVRALRGGHVEQSVLYVRGGTTAVTRLRSDGTARDSIVANSPGLSAGIVAVDYAFPTGFLVATLAGALLGGATAFFQGRRRPLRSLPRALLVGLLPGVLLAIAVGALGMKLRDFEPAVPGGEAFVLFVAAVGAYAGARGLGKLLPVFG